MYEQEKERIKQILGGDNEEEKEHKALQVLNVLSKRGHAERMALVHELNDALNTLPDTQTEITQEMADAQTPEERLATLRIAKSIQTFLSFQIESE